MRCSGSIASPGAERVQRRQRLAGCRTGSELQQGERARVVPGRGRRRISRRRAVEQRQRLGPALLLQEVCGEVELCGGVARIGRHRLAQQRLGRVRIAGETQKGAEVGGGCGVTGIAQQRLAHRQDGVIDRVLPVAGDAPVHPGVGPVRPELQGGGEGLLGAPVLAKCRPGLAVGIVRLGLLRRGMAGGAGGLKCGPMIAGGEVSDRQGEMLCLSVDR